MKHLIIISLLVLSTFTTQAQEPETVYSFALVSKPLSWQKEQVKAWKAEIDKNPQNAIAWLNYYLATRNVLKTDPADKRTYEEKQEDLYKLVDNMGKAIPNSYEYNLCMWKNNGFDFKYYPYLEKAIALGAGRTEHLDYIINIAEMNRDVAKRNEASIKKWEAGLLSPGMMYYNYNVLAGLEPNAILVTAGDNDTYPAWCVQAQGFRTDVTVINTSLIMVQEYRERLFKELGVTFTPPKSEDMDEFKKELVKALVNNNKGYPLYIGLTAIGHDGISKTIQDKLYLTGLAYLYCENPIDEKAVLKKNFEQIYTLDYISRSFYTDISAPLVKVINQNYIVPMLKLYDHYKAAGDINKQTWIKELVLAVSKGTGCEADVNKHLN